MKYIILLFLFLLPLHLFSQYLLPNEVILYSFETKEQKKMVLVKDKNNNYIQYRFGGKDKVELAFPTEKNAESWNMFSYNYYMRGGGKANAGQEIANLSFTQNGFQYLIYSTYFSEEESIDTGILVTNLKTQKRIRIKGLIKTRKESLFFLQEKSLLKVDEESGLDF